MPNRSLWFNLFLVEAILGTMFLSANNPVVFLAYFLATLSFINMKYDDLIKRLKHEH